MLTFYDANILMNLKNISNSSQKTGIFTDDAKVTKIKFFSHEKTDENNL